MMKKELTLQRRKAYVEILEVIKRLDKKLLDKVPIKLIDFFEENKLESYNYIYDEQKPISQQNLSNTTLTLLAMINLNYWCEDELHKRELIKKYEENDKIYCDVEEKYGIESVFKNEEKNT